MAHYSGYVSSSITFSGTTWADLFSGMTVVDNAQVGIARAGSAFTFAAAGIYVVRLVMLARTSGSPLGFIGIRVRGASATLAQQISNVNTNSGTGWTPLPFLQLFQVGAGEIATLQRCSQSGSAAAMGGDTLDGEATRPANISFHKVA